MIEAANDNASGIRFLSVCSGIEAASCAWHPLGWRAVAFSEIEKFPSAVLAHHYPDVPNLGDFTKIDTTTLGQVDILAGGTPCFTAGHLVLTEKGYAPIEAINVGDKVVTHKGRLRTVVRIGNEVKEVGILRGVGMCEPITCTPDHPFLAVEWRNQNTKRNNVYAKVEHCGHPDWVAASDMPGKQWCQLTSYDTDEPLCKIGIANSPEKRLKQLSTSSPHALRLELTRYSENARAVEAAAHSHFSAERRNGEWFAVTASSAINFVNSEAARRLAV